MNVYIAKINNVSDDEFAAIYDPLLDQSSNEISQTARGLDYCYK